jgi:integrase
VATSDQVWALYEEVAEHYRPAILLGAFAGLRISEAAGLRIKDVDFMRGIITPAVQYNGEPLKTEGSGQPIPIPQDLALMLSAAVKIAMDKTGGEATHVVTTQVGQPTSPSGIDRAVRAARSKVEGMSETFTHHDLRHHYASTLIEAGLSVKVVQQCLRHQSATTTLNTYSHLFPGADESARTAVGTAISARADILRTLEA